MHNLRKLYALKKANKNNIIHIYTLSNGMCSAGNDTSRAWVRVGVCVCVLARQTSEKETTHDPSATKYVLP